MPEITTITTAGLTVSRDAGTGAVTIEIRDVVSQSHRSYVIPERLLPAIRDALTDAIAKHPELFPVTHTRRIE